MEQCLSVEQAAERLGVEYKAAYRLIRAGKLPAGRIGRAYRTAGADLQQFFEAQKQRVREGAAGEPLVAQQGLHCGSCGQSLSPPRRLRSATSAPARPNQPAGKKH
jgi:excisionase family DNA binding protein